MLVHGVQRYLGFTGRFVGYSGAIEGWAYVCSIRGEVQITGYGDGGGHVVHMVWSWLLSILFGLGLRGSLILWV